MNQRGVDDPRLREFLDAGCALLAPQTGLFAAAEWNFERQIHGFALMGRVIDEAEVAVQLCAAQLKQALA